ncbi:MAG: hypothetical protein RBS16_04455 [Candidatus Cloacimonadales bacterium]|jgi:chromosome segregation ATPase|nr:hypothetical protein [Candidatus Cloacimonadales bacterium]
MNNLKQKIDEYLEQLDTDKKDETLGQLILHCLSEYSFDNIANLDEFIGILNQLISQINYAKSKFSAQLEQGLNDQISKLGNLKQENDDLTKQLESRKVEINNISEELEKKEKLLDVLSTIDSMLKEKPDLQKVADNYHNEFKYFDHIVSSYSEFKDEMETCEKLLSSISDKTKQIVKEADDFEKTLRGKTDEV